MRGVVSAMLSRMFLRSSRTFFSESARASLYWMRCSVSYFLRSCLESPAYQASKAALARAVESAR